MSVAPDPAEIFDCAVDEGQRRLEQSLLELAATSFIAGVTISFGYRFDASIGTGALGETIAVSAAGNVVGGIGLVTFAHVAQVQGAEGSDD